jgi:hypothetical protein
MVEMETTDRIAELDLTLQSLPSDEWGTRRSGTGASVTLSSSPADDVAERSKSRLLTKRFSTKGESVEEESARQSENAKHSYTTSFNSNSIADYLSHLISTSNFAKSATTVTETRTTAIDARGENRAETRGAVERSSHHSRCIIENTESIQERRDDDDDAHRDQNDDVMSSVEEISQISDITMDIRTVMAESKFGTCSTLPTIAEAKRYNPAGCVSPMSIDKESGCAAAETKSGLKKDIMDYVFELVEDAFCTPLNGSRADKKKAFAKAFQEESLKLSRNADLVDAFQATSSKLSRSNRTQRRSGSGHSNVAQLSPASSTKPAIDGVTVPTTPAPFVPSLVAKNEPAYVIVDRAPTPPSIAAGNDKIQPGRRTSAATVDDDQTLDWSKIMSFAERQLDDRSVFTNTKSVYTSTADSKVGRIGRASRRSFFDNNSVTGDSIKPNNTLTSFATAKSKLDLASTAGKPVSSCKPGKAFAPDAQPTASTFSNSVSTHATASGVSSASEVSAVVQELRELPAMDTSSFEEEPRLLFTSLLFRMVKQLIPALKNDDDGVNTDSNEDSLETPSSGPSSGPSTDSTASSQHLTLREDCVDEKVILTTLRYIAFVLAFVFWPEGIPRRKIEYPPIPKRVDKPSLLKLVIEAPPDEEQQRF